MYKFNPNRFVSKSWTAQKRHVRFGNDKQMNSVINFYWVEIDGFIVATNNYFHY